MFRGVQALKIDAKNRLSLPSRYHSELSENSERTLVATIDIFEPCLLLYPLAEWELIEKKLEELPGFDVSIRRVQRLLLGHATEMGLDGQGRLLLPQMLRQYANLSDAAVLVGQGKKFELWDEMLWASKCHDWLQMAQHEQASIPEVLRAISL